MMTFFLSILDLSFFARGTQGADRFDVRAMTGQWTDL
jgi:hypothetical protein